jgi:hypothetical protein
VYHIKSKIFDGHKDGYVLGLDYYNYVNHEISKLEKLCQDYIATNQAPQEDRNQEPTLLSLA